MKLSRFFQTNDSVTTLVLRLSLALVMFPHGAQKLFGWWGGFGFANTMNFFTGAMGIPWIFGFLAVLAESVGALALALGLFSRLTAFGIGFTISVAGWMVARPNGFFMNWFGNQKGEGFEYHILMVALAVAVVVQGGGKWALDGLIARWLGRDENLSATGAFAEAKA